MQQIKGKPGASSGTAIIRRDKERTVRLKNDTLKGSE